MSVWRVAPSLLLLAVLSATALSLGGEPRGTNPFPLTPGTFWIYEGTIRWTAEGTNRVATKQVQYRMEVKRVVEREGLKVALVSGFPGDLDWSEGETPYSITFIVETKDERFYLVDPPDEQG